ncbi:unnamed protein product [Polarella glacialis]|uniref:NADAR domain-containing protein n=1 Tax=Polarella glacialis TaxID=89957 RepID=A0A813FSS9_POLGL|nr:unnamed protein product [Polarella glacialis]
MAKPATGGKATGGSQGRGHGSGSHGTRRAEGSSDSRSGSSNAARGKRGASEPLEQQPKRLRCGLIAEALIREAAAVPWQAALRADNGTDSRPCASHSSNNNNPNNNNKNNNNNSTVRPQQLDFEDPWRGQQAALQAAKSTDYRPCAGQSTYDSTVRPRELGFEDPRQRQQPGQQPQNVGLIAFYFPGYREPCDERCKADFLGNFFPCCISLRPPDSRKSRCFQNAEAAFQALKFWHHEQAEEFERSSGEQAFQLKRRLGGAEDWSYGGCGTNWLAMDRVLRQKFKLHSEMSRRLLDTGEAFLLEHNAHPGRDKIWSDNGNGEGWNWLGLQLMSLRDELRWRLAGGDLRDWMRWKGKNSWLAWLVGKVVFRTGAFCNPMWQEAVRSASIVIDKAVAPPKVLQPRPKCTASPQRVPPQCFNGHGKDGSEAGAHRNGQQKLHQEGEYPHQTEIRRPALQQQQVQQEEELELLQNVLQQQPGLRGQLSHQPCLPNIGQQGLPDGEEQLQVQHSQIQQQLSQPQPLPQQELLPDHVEDSDNNNDNDRQLQQQRIAQQAAFRQDAAALKSQTIGPSVCSGDVAIDVQTDRLRDLNLGRVIGISSLPGES